MRPAANAIHHLRPAWWSFLWAHSFAGYLLATGSRGLEGENLLRGLVAGGMWAVLLGGPAIGIAALFGAAPPPDESPRTPALGWTSVILMLVGMVLSPMVGWEFFDVVLLGMILAVIHGVPPLRLGRTAAGGILCRAIGVGSLTVFSGYAAAGIGFDRAARTLWPMGIFFFLAIAAGALAMPGKRSRAGAAGFVLALLSATACAVFFALERGWHWYGAVLALPPLAAWAILGLARFSGRERTAEPPSLFLLAAAWFLTDLCFVLMGMIG